LIYGVHFESPKWQFRAFLFLKNSSASMVGYYKNSEKTIKGGGVPQGKLGMFYFRRRGIAAG
jgi:hypothetical protein